MKNTNINGTDTYVNGQQFVGKDLNFGARVIFIIVGSFEIISGVAGNLLLLSVLVRRQSLRKNSVHKFFIANLALSDFVTLGYWMTFFVLDLYLRRHPVVNMTHCLCNGVIIAVCFLSTALSLTSITLNRYLHVCHNRLYTRIFSLRTTIVWCLTIWVVALAIALPGVLGFGSYHYNPEGHFCSFRRDDPNPYGRSVVGTFSLVPMLFVGFWNYCIYRFWKKARGSLYQNQKNQQNNRRRKCYDSFSVRTVFCRANARQKTLSTEKKLKSEGQTGTQSSQSGASEGQNDREPRQTGSQTSISDHSGIAYIDEDSETAINDRPSITEEHLAKNTDAISVDIEGVSLSSEDSDSEVRTDQALATNAEAKTVQVTPSAEHSKTQDRNTETTESEIEDTCWSASGTRIQSASVEVIGTKKTRQIETEVKHASRSADGSKSLSGGSEEDERRSQTPPHKRPLSSLQQLQARRKAKLSKEVALIRSLRVVFLLMVVAFVPYGISVVVNSFIPLPPEAVISADLIMFFNNAVNWIVYGAMNPSFRRDYKRNLRWMFSLYSRLRSANTREADADVMSLSQSQSKMYTLTGTSQDYSG